MGKKRRQTISASANKPASDTPRKVSKWQFFAPSIIFAILAFAFFTRINAIYIERSPSFDESLYNFLGTQFKHQPFNYSPSGFFKRIEARFPPGEEKERVRRYVDVPLFKHPPLFPYLIMMFKIIFGDGWMPGAYVSLFFGIGTVFIVYLLCKNLWGEVWGLLAALFMAIEPISWFCSQKVWIETTLTFFVYAGMLFLLLVSKDQRFLIASGISLGLAMLCKYAAVLAVMPIYLVVLTADIITDKKRLALFICIPFAVGLPWILWNYVIYGSRLFVEIIKTNSSSDPNTGGFNFILKFVLMAIVPVLCLLGFLAFRCFFIKNPDSAVEGPKDGPGKGLLKNIVSSAILITVLIFGFLSRDRIMSALSWSQMVFPVSVMDAFNDHPKYFYFYHMVELSIMAIAAYSAVIFFRKWDEWIFMLALIPLSLFSFFGLFGYYESRYVMIATPALAALATYTVREALAYSIKQPPRAKKLLITAITCALIYAAAKTLYFDMSVVSRNNFVFF